MYLEGVSFKYSCKDSFSIFKSKAQRDEEPLKGTAVKM